jgi:uncharacterized protein YndB with AHSA1/START domain
MGGSPEELRIERKFEAPAEAVFEAWTSAEVLKRWWHAEHDWETPHAEVDLRLGGSVRVTMRNPADGSEYGGEGEFTEIRRPHRLAFTWRWHDQAGSAPQTIEVDFHERDGATTVVLTHRGLAPQQQDEYRDGWEKSLDNLGRALRA